MTIKSTQPVVVVYTTNWVPNSDSNHRQHAAVCLETCEYPDAVNMREVAGFPKHPTLKMGERNYQHQTVHYFTKDA